jgi:hypothetical protein
MPRLERPTGGPFTQRSRANECPLEFVKSDLTHSANCCYLIVGNTGRVAERCQHRQRTRGALCGLNSDIYRGSGNANKRRRLRLATIVGDSKAEPTGEKRPPSPVLRQSSPLRRGQRYGPNPPYLCLLRKHQSNRIRYRADPNARQSIGATPKLCAAPPITETLPASMNLVRRGNQGDF